MYDLDFLSNFDRKSLDAIRIVFPYGKHVEGLKVAKQILDKGYKVYLQAANTLAYNNDDLIDLANEVNKLNIECLSIVDTFGAMYEEDLERIVNILDKHLKNEISLGFHSHNNQQLSYALCIHFINLLKKSTRSIIVDSSLCGMGRGAGNATTELVVSYLNRKCGCHYDLNAVMDAIDIYMEPFIEKYKWGYSTPYFISGLYCCHVNNIAYLQENHRTKFKDMKNIIESLDVLDRRKYDYDLLENKYLENQNKYVDDYKTIELLRNVFKKRKVLLIAPGKTSITKKDKIEKFINEENPIIIGVNSIIGDYKYNYLFFVNNARYEYASKYNKQMFNDVNKIILSNIKNESDEELIIEYSKVVKAGYEHFDNAMIVALYLMKLLNVDNVAISGFDGFKDKYNESYADENLPSLNNGCDWNKLNKEIKMMFEAFKKFNDGKMNISFITESIYNK